jgi:hypothetical protein
LENLAGERLGFIRTIFFWGLGGAGDLGLFFRQEALNRLPLGRIDLSQKQLPKVGDVQVRNSFIHGCL